MRVSRLIALSTLALLPAFAAAQSSDAPAATAQTAATDTQTYTRLLAELGRNRQRTASLLSLVSPNRCYALRDYSFTRTAPNSDATRLTASAVCEPASQFHLRATTVAPIQRQPSGSLLAPSSNREP